MHTNIKYSSGWNDCHHQNWLHDIRIYSELIVLVRHNRYFCWKVDSATQLVAESTNPHLQFSVWKSSDVSVRADCYEVHPPQRNTASEYL